MDRGDENHVTIDVGLSAGSASPSPQIIRKWPHSFWALLKVLCLYHHRSVVIERRCQHCHFKHLQLQHIPAGFSRNMRYLLANYDRAAIEYESKGISSHVAWQHSGSTGEYERLLGGETELPGGTINGAQCEVCDAWWLNSDGRSVRYNEQDIGIRYWNHPGSGLIAGGIISIMVVSYFFRIGDAMLNMWGVEASVLELITQMTFFLTLMIHPLMVFGSKLRSTFNGITPNIPWASTFNVRYLVKRAQVMALERDGLPGNVYLAVCILYPIVIAAYTAVILEYFLECGITLDSGRPQKLLIGIVLMEYWGLAMYLFYFIRLSLQHQFGVLLFYFKQNEGMIDKCRGALYTTLVDFACFRGAANFYSLLMCPVLVAGIVANITTNYMLKSSCHMEDNYGRANMNIAILQWMEIIMGTLFYAVSFGGFHVEYVLTNFVFQLRFLRSGRHPFFWDALIQDASDSIRSPFPVLLTIAFSVVGILTGLNFSNQDIATTVCNSTYVESICV